MQAKLLLDVKKIVCLSHFCLLLLIVNHNNNNHHHQCKNNQYKGQLRWNCA